MTITKEQIEKALEWFNNFMEDTCCGNCQPFSKCMVDQDEVKTTQSALRLAHKVMILNADDAVKKVGYKPSESEYYAFIRGYNAAIDEVGNE